VPELDGLDETAWLFISSIYESRWDSLHTNKENKMFGQKVVSKFISNTHSYNSTSNSNKSKNKPMEIIKLPSFIPARLPKRILEKLKFFKKGHKLMEKVKPYNKLSYAQALTLKVSDVLKIKENYSSLPAKKIENIHKIINYQGKSKFRINMTIKGPSRKQIIIPMNNDVMNLIP